MPRGGFRPGSGPKKGTKYKPKDDKKEKLADIPAEAAAENLTPLDYMLKVMNDPANEKDLRLRAASLAAPFIHPRADSAKGKKGEREERAKVAGGGKFAAGAPPLKVVK